MSEPENLVLKLLREMRGEMTTKKDLGELRSEMATKSDLADVRADLNSLRADVASDFLLMEKRMGERFGHLNRAVVGYHSSVVGQGLLISEFEDRLRRVEDHLKLPPVEKH